MPPRQVTNTQSYSTLIDYQGENPLPAARTRRTETEAVRRAQLLTAARDVFREKGYDGARVSEIVQRAGVAQGTFYLYSPSKPDAAVALRDGLMQQLGVIPTPEETG